MIKVRHGIRLRIVLLYWLLVFIAITIIGVFIMAETENYLRGTLDDNIRNSLLQGTLLSRLGDYDNLRSHSEEIQKDVDAWASSLNEEIFIIDDTFEIVAATSHKGGISAIGLLDESLILKGLTGQIVEKDSLLNSQNGSIPVMNKVFPIEGEKYTGVLYVRSDLSSINDALKTFQEIFLKAMAVALFVTILLGFLISRSITEPINHLTSMAGKMAEGDFSSEVKVKSKDEIGQLAEMFDILRLELNKMLSQINNEKSKLETILSHMADGLIAVDERGQIIHANQAALDILKTSREVAANSDYDNLIEGIFYHDMTYDYLREKVKEGPQIQSVERDGFIYSVRFDKFKDEKDEDKGLIIIIQDITERHKLESIQMDFVANVSHELKTPLTTIKSYAETMLDSCPEDPNEARGFMEIIDGEADRMARLVRELLQLSRLEYKQEETLKEKLDICSLLNKVLTKLSIQAKIKDQQINKLFDQCLKVEVLADKDQIEQVLLNIITNAIKYTEAGGRIDIDIRTDWEQVRIMVRDNGVGLSKEDVSRVFERFFRADKARTREMGGTGLGLSISKQIVENHGGKLTLESSAGKGTTVTILLPVYSNSEGIKEN